MWNNDFSPIYITRHEYEISWPLTDLWVYSCALYEWIKLNIIKTSGKCNLHNSCNIFHYYGYCKNTQVFIMFKLFCMGKVWGRKLTWTYTHVHKNKINYVSRFSFTKQVTCLLTLFIFWDTEGDGQILLTTRIKSINKLLNDWH